METMTQPKITGYRQLTEEEVALMNEGKALAEKCGEYIEKLRQAGPCQAPGSKVWVADRRWISIGEEQLQQGFMALTRSIAQPTTF